MMIPEQRRERYMQDPLPRQLGNLASNLGRLASCAQNPLTHHSVPGVLLESCRFAEWAAERAPYETQVILADTQQAVVRWASTWKHGARDPMMPTEAERRAEELLKIAGLI